MKIDELRARRFYQGADNTVRLVGAIYSLAPSWRQIIYYRADEDWCAWESWESSLKEFAAWAVREVRPEWVPTPTTDPVEVPRP